MDYRGKVMAEDLVGRLRTVEALRLFAPGSHDGWWGRVKAWIVNGAPTREDGIAAAKQITEWQCLVDDALEDALRPLPQEGQTEIEIIVNGQPVNVTAGPIREVIAEAVQRSGQIGAPIDQWVLRTTDGEVIPHALPGGVEWALSGGQRLWLHLGLPASLRLSETTQLTKDEDDLTRSGEPVTAPSDVHASSSRAVPASGSVELEAALKYAIALVADRISFEASDNRALLARYVEALREVVALAELDYASNSPRKPQPKGSATDSSSSLSPSETPEGWQPHKGWDALIAIKKATSDLPGMSAPQCVLEDDGGLCLDWDGELRRQTLSVSVLPSGRIGWAGLIGEWKGHGSCDDTPSQELLDAFKRLSEAL
jgi:hypothetical protein